MRDVDFHFCVQDVEDVIDVTVPVQILVQRTVNPATNREVMKIELSGRQQCPIVRKSHARNPL